MVDWLTGIALEFGMQAEFCFVSESAATVCQATATYIWHPQTAHTVLRHLEGAKYMLQWLGVAVLQLSML